MSANHISPRLVKDTKISSSGVLLPVMSGLTAVIIIFLIYAFFSGWTFNFYANILFGFYALTKQMWVSVMLLGVTQTILMIPFRMVRVFRSQHTRRFQEKIEEFRHAGQQIAKVKKTFRQGNLTFLFYLVDFMVQLTLFISIGRLFLTDFYSNQIEPHILWKFIPYPQYPLQGLWFKIPYPVITRAKDLGWWVVILVWVLILLFHVFIYLFKRYQRQMQQRAIAMQTDQPAIQDEKRPAEKINSHSSNQVLSFFGSSTVIAFVGSYLLVRHLPLAWTMKIFTGDVSIPNRTLNTVTAVVTFVLFIWFGLQDIIRQGKLAHETGVAQAVIDVTQKEMFRTTLFNSALIGLGAFFITNLIPSAFELSIFTFELIALLSPLTLDKFVLKINSPPG